MPSRGCFGFVLAFSLLIEAVAALGNTSPVIVLSDKRRLNTAALETESGLALQMDHILDTLLASASQKCPYNAYIFVTHPNVSEREITAESMPFLMHAVDKAEGKFLTDVAVDNEEVEASVKSLQEQIQHKCDVVAVAADIHSDSPVPAVSDSKSRMITVDFTSGTSASDADDVLRKVVGHLASGNFLLTYRTTPRQAQRESPSSGGPAPAALTAGATPEVKYESVFRNYQFFSPALFMSLIVSALLLGAFLIALNSVNSLQISTAAFEPKRQPVKKQ